MLFKKNKYLVSFWYELDNSISGITDAYLEINFKIKNEFHLSKIKQKAKEEIELQTRKKCNCIGIINFTKI